MNAVNGNPTRKRGYAGTFGGLTSLTRRVTKYHKMCVWKRPSADGQLDSEMEIA